VIAAAPCGHFLSVIVIAHELRPTGLSVEPRAAEETERAARNEARSEDSGRLRGIIDLHYDFVWRTIRNFGVDEADAEDAAQRVLCVLARRIADIPPGAEVSFLFSTATRVASDTRRASRRRPVVPLASVEELVAIAPSAEELVDERRAREVLHRVLDSMPIDLRSVFVLFELEEMTVAQVASVVGIPTGTVSSRLRRARESFQNIVRRLHAAQRDRAPRGRP
jgi:RNA polymerase sigma-70 factor (ECF subfamily)